MIEKAHELALDDQGCDSDGAAAQARLLAELEQEHGARVTANDTRPTQNLVSHAGKGKNEMVSNPGCKSSSKIEDSRLAVLLSLKC